MNDKGNEKRNDLREFFYARNSGPGIWKWDHYFDIYERHFGKFREKDIHVLEIGVYSGGSLDMWREYFGKGATIYGVDIQPECKAYERDGVRIFIGDQSSEAFWSIFRTEVPKLNIVIDDGSHKARHQLLTMKMLYEYLVPGGVYLCEDIHGYPTNEFANEIYLLAGKLNDHRGFVKNRDDPKRRLAKEPTHFQATINSIHLYPYVAVIEKPENPIKEFIAPKQGTQWQPFLGE